MEILQLEKNGHKFTGMGAPAALAVQGLALFCSRKCPGSLILQAFDLARELRDQRQVVIGGFHSPLEKELLPILLRGQQAVIICPARGLEGMRIPAAWRAPLEDGRLLILSPFGATVKRPTEKVTHVRNQFVADLAERILVIHAQPGGQVEELARDVIARGKELFTLPDSNNANLVDLGAKVWNGPE